MDVVSEAVATLRRECLVSILSSSTPNALVPFNPCTLLGSAHSPSASCFLPFLLFFHLISLFFHCIHCNILGIDILHCGRNSPWFCLHVLHEIAVLYCVLCCTLHVLCCALLAQPEVDFQVISPNSPGSPSVPLSHDPTHEEPDSTG